MANSFPKELSEAQMAPPPYSPVRIRPPMAFPWRIDTPSHIRAWGGEEARQAPYNQLILGPNSARATLYRLRITIAGDIAGSWAKFGGLGQLANRLEACVENNAEVMTRVAEEEIALPAHTARSRAEPSDISQ